MIHEFASQLTSNEVDQLRLKVRKLSKLNSLWPILDSVIDWVLILVTIYYLENNFSWTLYVLGLFVIGSRMHALAILGHEGVHGRLFNSKKGNILFSNIFAAYPLFYQIEVYSDSHLRHHQFLNSGNDPDRMLHKDLKEWQFPMRWYWLLFYLVGDLIGRGAYLQIQRMIRYSGKSPRGQNLAQVVRKTMWLRLMFYTSFAVMFSITGFWTSFALYWLVPLLTTLPFLLRIRNISEHYGLNWSDELQSSRETVASSLERFIFAPHQIGHHLVHHLFPSIPYYNLREMYQFLQTYPVFEKGAHRNTSYCIPFQNSVLSEVLVD